VLSGLRTKFAGSAPTAGRRVVKSWTSEPAGVTGRPSDAGLFVTLMSAEELKRAADDAASTTQMTSTRPRAGARRAGREFFILWAPGGSV
jgi:hypothetical protein